jgi:transposase-like protein
VGKIVSTYSSGGHVNTSESGYGDRRRRRRHSAEFKARVVAACRKPGVSIAAVALDHRLNANLLRRWVVAAERAQKAGPIARAVSAASAMPANAAFVAVEVQRSPLASEIVIELRRGPTVVKVSWPLAAAAACGAWLGELLR